MQSKQLVCEKKTTKPRKSAVGIRRFLQKTIIYFSVVNHV